MKDCIQPCLAHNNVERSNSTAPFYLLFVCIVAFHSFLPIWAAKVHAGCAHSSDLPQMVWSYEDPTEAGWSLARLEVAHRWARDIGSTSVLVVQHGRIVAEWGDSATRSNVHSIRKSLLNALIGIAVAEGKIDLNATLKQLHMNDTEPALTPIEQSATLLDLLESRSGVYHPALYETSEMSAARPLRGSHLPGTFWYYNNWDFNALGAFYEKTEGESIFKAFSERIACPIGMQDYRPNDGHYIRDRNISIYPAYPVAMSARDLARFALLYLHGGMWNRHQIIPRSWIETSTTPASDTDSGGYGYMWWTANAATPGQIPPIRFPPGSFWAEGHLGQYVVIIPSFDLIIVNKVVHRPGASGVSKPEMAKLVRLLIEASPKP
jgi:CubicO group peptidase (beta-lactamase class C family)